ncbi:agmatinase [Candidatus Contendibacter odensensis]|uniref:Arginase/agmatinase/formimionoglutamate hydrolase n=1 Tax=Candidatus Contendobacter odensis Run_B_J11 TaxID=1400861 RepID=A0A7U7GCX9_9GAMM|nr:agmatinase [Candidatus Contendobacter odensis]CDH45494.1 Arginase/agmatinase/formimionoglutamate hydrolase [Candidatus Contendobacter odensis Run_B_J11]
MSLTPTFAILPRFLGVTFEPAARFSVAGVPFDIGTTNRAGARAGPLAVRHASRMLVDGDNPANWRDPRTLGLADVGDFALALGDIPASLALIEQQAARFPHLVAIGGDHTITLALLRALARRSGPLGMVHFDAHVDTWPDSFGQPLGHGSVFYRAITEGLVDPRRMIQIGIRSPVARAVYEWTLAQGVRIVSAEEVHMTGPQAVADLVLATVGTVPVYLSFDIDAIDPGQAPGTGTPEVGGLFTWQVMAILKRLGGLDFKGMDVVEVAPAYDIAEITALAAASVVWQYLSLQS